MSVNQALRPSKVIAKVQAEFHARYPASRQIDADEILLALRLHGYDVVPVERFATLGRQAVERGVMSGELVRAWDAYMLPNGAGGDQEGCWEAVKQAIEGLRQTLSDAQAEARLVHVEGSSTALGGDEGV